MNTGTLKCKLFGHSFHGERVVFDPHYLKLVEMGIASRRMKDDFHMVGFQTDYCTRCGIDKIIK